ncbi:hypothetical protein ACISSW_25585, partial [Escherichia coli]
KPTTKQRKTTRKSQPQTRARLWKTMTKKKNPHPGPLMGPQEKFALEILSINTHGGLNPAKTDRQDECTKPNYETDYSVSGAFVCV